MTEKTLKLHVTEAGDGRPALVFIHYWGGSGGTWRLVVERLSTTYRCIAPDLRGWGSSPKEADDFGLEIMADDIAALVKRLRLDDYVLVGHSMGGKIAQILGGRRPMGLAGLVLVAPAPPTPLTAPPEFRERALANYQSRDGMNEVLEIMAGDRPLASELRESVIVDTLAGSLAAKRAWLGPGMDLDITKSTSSIEAPTLVIVGSADKVETEETLRREIGQRVPQAAFHIVPGVGHLSPLEAPDQVADAIRRFLAD